MGIGVYFFFGLYKSRAIDAFFLFVTAFFVAASAAKGEKSPKISAPTANDPKTRLVIDFIGLLD